ncbi:MAG: ATP-binding protein, partial [bacterium]
PVANVIPHDDIVFMLQTIFTDEELAIMKDNRVRSARLDFFGGGTTDLLTALWNNDQYRKKTRLLMKSIYKRAMDKVRPSKAKEGVELRLDEVCSTLKLGEVERQILLLAYIKSSTCFEFPRRIEDSERPIYFAMALDRSFGEVSKAMNGSGKLRKFNVLDGDWDFNQRAFGGYLAGTEKDAIERKFYKKSEGEPLPWEYFGQLARTHGKVLTRMLRANRGKGGMNILLYGAAGTGKTSFAAALVKEAGFKAYEIKQGGNDGKNMSAESRMAGIQICNAQVDSKESLMIIDEADELLRGGGMGFIAALLGLGGGKSTEKGIINTILDEMSIPAIWISNAPASEMDESVRRRFDYSVCFEKLNSAQREAIWNNGIAKFKLQKLISAEMVPGLASKYLTSVGGISTVLANVKKMSPRNDEVESTIAVLMKQHCELMQTYEKNKFVLAKDYSLNGLNIKGNVSLEKIIRAARNFSEEASEKSVDKPRLNILMCGPPGSGKTEFVKYLGSQLGKRVIVKKGSDILGMYVGQTEAQIRAAFAEAEAEQAVLFFDEIDGIMQSRESAHASWEVSKVNELLQQMEDFNGIMVAATNFHKNLDPAMLRRFTFKLEFDYLTNEGKRHFFEHMFGTKLDERMGRMIDDVENLCPADYRTVRQSLHYLGEETSADDYLSALKAEAEAKPKTFAHSRIGF